MEFRKYILIPARLHAKAYPMIETTGEAAATSFHTGTSGGYSVIRNHVGRIGRAEWRGSGKSYYLAHIYKYPKSLKRHLHFTAIFAPAAATGAPPVIGAPAGFICDGR
ncbi:MAG: hypothetical protein P4L55_19615 [Syntrophobacteraceae bacterium]|nr:hypothetical protein [Syntrophobacteraceae bacterium]